MTHEFGSDTRHRILDAAAEVFAQRGFRAATIASIAHSAGLNAITVYRYFPKKQLIYWEALDQRLRTSGLMDHVRYAINSESAPMDFVSSVAAEAIQCLDRDPALTRLLYFAVLELDAEKAMLFRVYLRPLFQLLTDRIEDWVKTGKTRTVDPEAVAVLLAGVVVSYCNLHELTHRLSPEDMAARCAEICVAGIMPS